MSQTNQARAVETARAYYDSDDADTFYAEVWGGEDIHVGLYACPDESIAEASRRTCARMAELAGPLGPATRVLDLGAGYGGAVRYLAGTFGCSCVALNLAEVENERNRRMTREAGLEALVEVVPGDFTAIPFENDAFDRVWSQEALLHAGDRAAVCAQAARVLKPGGLLVFTDPMQVDGVPADRLQPVYDRLHLESLASPRFYRDTLTALGLREVLFEEQPEQLVSHYARVRDVLIASTRRLRERGVGDDYIERMKTGLGHWVDGGREGLLTWGIFVFRKEAP